MNKQQKRRRAKVKSHRQAARRGQEGVRYYEAEDGLGMLKKFPARARGPGQSATGTRAETDILAVGQQSHQLYLREIVGQG